MCLAICLLSTNGACAGDWPQWRYDAQHSAASPDSLPSDLKLLWSRKLPRLRPAWPDQPKMQLDQNYEPIVVGTAVVVASSFDDSLTAYDTTTGDQRWRFYANGPIRYAPVASHGKLYVASDDGYLYCLDAAQGKLIWRFRGGPSDRRILGNERMISTWPARGAPVVADGTVYFAAGIWPFMGIFLHALDAETGRVVWTNDGDGSRYMKQPHNSDSFAGVAPQGPLTVVGDKLLVPGGRSVPACYDRRNGKLLYYELADNGKRGGGVAVSATDSLLLNGEAVFDLTNEKYLGPIGELFAFRQGQLHDYHNGILRSVAADSAGLKTVETIDRKGEKGTIQLWGFDELGRAKAPSLTALIQAGTRLYAGQSGEVMAIKLPLPEKGSPEVAWREKIAGTPVSLAAGNDKLVVTTEAGELLCFGKLTADKKSKPAEHSVATKALSVESEWSARVKSLIESTRVDAGYALVNGVASGQLVRALLQETELRLVIVEPDETLAHEFRLTLSEHGIGGDRAAVLIANPLEAELPPYWASLVLSESPPRFDQDAQANWLRKLFALLRPFGGVAAFAKVEDPAAVQATVDLKSLPGAKWQAAGEYLLLKREGALPDSANWTHEHADAANTRVSKDRRVKAPLGILWFGGPSNDGILPRHGHGPQPQVVDGRLFIEGVDMLRATDIYTGRKLWEAKLPGVGALYDNFAHQPGANASGTNYIATPEGIYVAYRRGCVKLNPVDGRIAQRFKLPGETDDDEPPLWGYINVVGDYLIGGAEPLYDPSLLPRDGKIPTSKVPVDKSQPKIDNDNYSSSARLVVLDRKSGEVRWSASARSGFRHNAICAGGGRLYCIDRLSGAQVARLKRRGQEPPHPPRLIVFELATGKELWSTEQDVFGTWLSYSAERDLLVEAGRMARDTLTDEPKGMRVYDAPSGQEKWYQADYAGPAMLHHDTILMAGKACDLLTGELRMREHPLTGEPVEWTWSRNYGCNTPLASEHLLTFRSGAAGYFDLCNDGGTGNFGGFRSSCTNNLIVAGGLINAPEYTRTCTCSYQNQTSLALIHMPEVEAWTSFGAQTPKEPVKRVGINLAAPGDRKADDGTLWLEIPSVGGASPVLDVELQPASPGWYRRHSSQVSGDALSWVAASGAIGLKSLSIKLAEERPVPRKYTVRLVFLEPDNVAPGERRFDVALQGRGVLRAFDIRQEAGERNRGIIREFKGVEIGEELLVELTADPQAKVPVTLLSGVEILSEGW